MFGESPKIEFWIFLAVPTDIFEVHDNFLVLMVCSIRN